MLSSSVRVGRRRASRSNVQFNFRSTNRTSRDVISFWSDAAAHPFFPLPATHHGDPTHSLSDRQNVLIILIMVIFTGGRTARSIAEVTVFLSHFTTSNPDPSIRIAWTRYNPGHGAYLHMFHSQTILRYAQQSHALSRKNQVDTGICFI